MYTYLEFNINVHISIKEKLHLNHFDKSDKLKLKFQYRKINIKSF